MKFVSHAHSILVAAVKHTDADQEVIHAALALSRATLDVELNFIHVVDPQPSREGEAHPAPDLIADGSIFLDAIVAEALPLTPARVVGHLAIGNALPRILELAGDLDADLLIVGTHTHPRAALAWLWGSTSRRLVRLAPCTVLVARERASHDKARRLSRRVHRASTYASRLRARPTGVRPMLRATCTGTSTTSSRAASAAARCSSHRKVHKSSPIFGQTDQPRTWRMQSAIADIEREIEDDAGARRGDQRALVSKLTPLSRGLRA